MTILVCHIGWMDAYEGLVGVPDKIVGGGRWVREHKDGGETCNFLKCSDGYVYGHVETIKGDYDRPINIEQLGAAHDAAYIDHIDVIWTATHPKEKGRWVVGYYRDARVYREREKFEKLPSKQHRLEGHKHSFRVMAKADNTLVIPWKNRKIKLGRGKGWIGQANWWFPEKSKNTAVKAFLRKVHKLLDSGTELPPENSLRNRRGSGHWGGKTDPLRKAEVERAAITKVSEHYKSYKIKSVEKDNLGWDLEARRKGEKVLHLEVKGLFGSDLKIGLTPNEYRAFTAHLSGELLSYRLCVVTGALSGESRLVIFRYDRLKNSWVDDCSDCRVAPRIDPIQAAIVSL